MKKPTEAEIRIAQAAIKELLAPPKPFTVDFELGQLETTWFNGKTFQHWIDQVLPWTRKLRAIQIDRNNKISYSGKGTDLGAISISDSMMIIKRILPAGESLICLAESTHRIPQFGYVAFDRDIRIPILFDPRNGDTWMSLTPNEVGTCRTGIAMAQRRVLIGGLGLGWMAREIAFKPDVSQVIVVEQDAGIARFVGGKLKQASKKIKIVHADVWDYLAATHLQFDSYCFDIWLKYGDAQNDQDYQAFKLAQSNVWAWGDTVNTKPKNK